MNREIVIALVVMTLTIVQAFAAPDRDADFSHTKVTSEGVTPFKTVFLGEPKVPCWQCSPPCGNGYCCDDGFPQCCTVSGFCRCCRW